MSDCDTCVNFARLDEQVKFIKTEQETMWIKLDLLGETIGIGKNWIIGIMVSSIFSLVGVLATLIVVILRT